MPRFQRESETIYATKTNNPWYYCPRYHLKHGHVVRTVLYHARDNAVSGFQALRQSVERPSPCHARTFLPHVAHVPRTA